MTEFTPIASLIGGMMIGLAAVLKMVLNGRIAGISGIISRLLPPNIDRIGLSQGIAFIIGLLLAIPIYRIVTGEALVQTVSTNYLLLIVAGLFVGFGSVLGNGCTSGHGVCGMSRLSIRSIIATLTFMFTGIVTVYIIRHVMGA